MKILITIAVIAVTLNAILVPYLAPDKTEVIFQKDDRFIKMEDSMHYRISFLPEAFIMHVFKDKYIFMKTGHLPTPFKDMSLIHNIRFVRYYSNAITDPLTIKRSGRLYDSVLTFSPNTDNRFIMIQGNDLIIRFNSVRYRIAFHIS